MKAAVGLAVVESGRPGGIRGGSSAGTGKGYSPVPSMNSERTSYVPRPNASQLRCIGSGHETKTELPN